MTFASPRKRRRAHPRHAARLPLTPTACRPSSTSPASIRRASRRSTGWASPTSGTSRTSTSYRPALLDEHRRTGFNGRLAPPRVIPACAVTTFPHARITLGGPGADGALTARAASGATRSGEITGVVREPGRLACRERARHRAASGTGDWITRSNLTGPDGVYAARADDRRRDARAVRTGNGRAPQVAVAAGDTSEDLTMPPSGSPRLGDRRSPAIRSRRASRCSPRRAPRSRSRPSKYGEEDVPDGRVAVAYAITGDATVRVPVGTFRVVASRGYESGSSARAC